MQKKITIQYYVLSGLLSFCGLSLTSAIYATFLMRHGLSLMEVNLVNGMFFAMLFIFEIPTGAYADIFGRKRAVVLACLLLALAKCIYALSTSFWYFVCAEVVAALAFTFQNGAFQAWFVDSMRHYGHEGSLTKKFARLTLINQGCGAIGALTGSYLFAMGSSIPWWSGAFMLLILAIIANVAMKESYFQKREFSLRAGAGSMWEIAKKSFYYAKVHKPVRFVLVVTFVQIFAVMSLNMYWQPFFQAKGLEPIYFGWLFFGMMSFLALGGFIVSKIDTQGREKQIILVTQMAAGLVVGVVAFVPTLSVALFFFMVHELPRGSWFPVKEGYLQQRIPSEERATISSFCSTAPHIGGAIGLVVSGVIAEYFGISIAWLVSGLVLIGGSLVVARNGNGSGNSVSDWNSASDRG